MSAQLIIIVVQFAIMAILIMCVGIYSKLYSSLQQDYKNLGDKLNDLYKENEDLKLRSKLSDELEKELDELQRSDISAALNILRNRKDSN